MLGYNKNYAILVLNCILKNLKEIISTSGIERRSRNNNIRSTYEYFPLLIYS